MTNHIEDWIARHPEDADELARSVLADAECDLIEELNEDIDPTGNPQRGLSGNRLARVKAYIAAVEEKAIEEAASIGREEYEELLERVA